MWLLKNKLADGKWNQLSESEDALVVDYPGGRGTASSSEAVPDVLMLQSFLMGGTLPAG